MLALMAGTGKDLVPDPVSSSLDNCVWTASSLYPESCDDISDFSPLSDEAWDDTSKVLEELVLASVSTSVFSTLLTLDLDFASLEFLELRFLLGLGLSGNQPLRSWK